MMESVLSSKVKGGRFKKIVSIEEGTEDMRAGLSSSTDSGRSDADAEEPMEEGNSTVMISEVLDLLSQRWERINGAQALKLLPRETKLQVNVLNLSTLLNLNYDRHLLSFPKYLLLTSILLKLTHSSIPAEPASVSCTTSKKFK